MDYTRQESVFDQAILKNSTLQIIGCSRISDFAMLYIAGLGIGNLRLVQYENKGFAKDIVSLVKTINPEINIEKTADFADADITADFTNSAESKKNALRHSKGAFVSASSDSCSAFVLASYDTKGIESRLRQPFSCSEQQGIFTSSLAAAVALDEIRKYLLPLPADEMKTGSLRFSISSKDRFSSPMLLEKIAAHKTPKGRALVVGAGGIGTYVALNLALLDFPFDIYDFDAIESTNLNRQIFYYDAIGRDKAITLKERLEGLFDAKGIRAFGSAFEGKSSEQYICIFSCVDSWESRKMLNKFALEKNIPLIDGGVSAFTARLDSVDNNLCLECRRGNVEQTKTAGGCASVAESNIVMCNAFIGALMTAELYALPKLNKQLLYFSKKPLNSKTALMNIEKQCSCSAEKACRCHRRGDVDEK